MNFTVKELEKFAIVQFELKDRMKPERLKELDVPKNTGVGVINLWLHGLTAFVAISHPPQD